jgi:hypothetical protein
MIKTIHNGIINMKRPTFFQQFDGAAYLFLSFLGFGTKWSSYSKIAAFLLIISGPFVSAVLGYIMKKK